MLMHSQRELAWARDVEGTDGSEGMDGPWAGGRFDCRSFANGVVVSTFFGTKYRGRIADPVSTGAGNEDRDST